MTKKGPVESSIEGTELFSFMLGIISHTGPRESVVAQLQCIATKAVNALISPDRRLYHDTTNAVNLRVQENPEGECPSVISTGNEELELTSFNVESILYEFLKKLNAFSLIVYKKTSDPGADISGLVGITFPHLASEFNELHIPEDGSPVALVPTRQFNEAVQTLVHTFPVSTDFNVNRAYWLPRVHNPVGWVYMVTRAILRANDMEALLTTQGAPIRHHTSISG